MNAYWCEKASLFILLSALSEEHARWAAAARFQGWPPAAVGSIARGPLPTKRTRTELHIEDVTVRVATDHDAAVWQEFLNPTAPEDLRVTTDADMRAAGAVSLFDLT